MDVILELKDIIKEYPGVKALNHMNLTVRTGEVHALMGENGAGKSTLIKVISGAVRPNGGKILYEGREYEAMTPTLSRKLGIGVVYQEFNLVNTMTVGENIFLGRYPKKGNMIDWKKLYKDAGELLQGMGLHIDAQAILNTYGTAAQQMISIARAISLNCKIIVLDEPTSSLDTDEVQMLFQLVKELKEKGIAVIFISHRLDEIYEISDRITVLKDGHYEGTYLASELSQKELITKMIGRELEQSEKIERSYENSSDECIIELDQIISKPKLKDISLRIKKGEIVGLAGLLGAGRTETAQVIFGYTVPDAGTIKVKDASVILRTPRDGLQHKMAFCTENRREEGIIPNMSVRDNILLSSLASISRHGFLDRAKGEEIVNEYIERFHIKTPDAGQKIKNLSGGNQQKVILARWLATQPDFIIFDEPTRGIDVGAKKDVEILIAQIADMGLGVLLISSEMSELARNCDRVYVLRDGKIAGEIYGAEIRQENITKIIAEGKR